MTRATRLPAAAKEKQTVREIGKHVIIGALENFPLTSSSSSFNQAIFLSVIYLKKKGPIASSKGVSPIHHLSHSSGGHTI